MLTSETTAQAILPWAVFSLILTRGGGSGNWFEDGGSCFLVSLLGFSLTSYCHASILSSCTSVVCSWVLTETIWRRGVREAGEMGHWPWWRHWDLDMLVMSLDDMSTSELLWSFSQVLMSVFHRGQCFLPLCIWRVSSKRFNLYKEHLLCTHSLMEFQPTSTSSLPDLTALVPPRKSSSPQVPNSSPSTWSQL